MARTAFLGLGVMGFHMAGHLARAGHQVSVWNRTGAKAAAWTGVHRGEAAKDPASAVFGAEYVLMCLGDDPDVRAVFEAFEPSLGAGMTVIDHTTASAGLYGACDVSRDSLVLPSLYSAAPAIAGSWSTSTCSLTLKPYPGRGASASIAAFTAAILVVIAPFDALAYQLAVGCSHASFALRTPRTR